MPNKLTPTRFIGGPAAGIRDIYPSTPDVAVRIGNAYLQHVYHYTGQDADGLEMYTYKGDDTSKTGLASDYYPLASTGESS
jgi:hypothetical protein